MAEWTCARCGAVNQGNFCTSCGAGRPDPAAAVAVEAAAAPTAEPAPAAVPAVPAPAVAAVPSSAAGPAPAAVADPALAATSAASAPRFASSFETGKHYRVHKSYIWLGPALAILFFLVIGLLNSASSLVQLFRAIAAGQVGGDVLLVVLALLGGFVAVYLLVLGIYVLSYRNMSYVFDEREFSYYSGIITKRRVHVPYARVQSVNHRASIAQRLVGVCTVSIDTAGGSSNKAVLVPYLQLAVAERLRVDLFMRKAAAAAGLESAVFYDPALDPTTPEGAARAAQAGTSAPVPPQQVLASAGAGVAGAMAPVAGAPVPPGVAPAADAQGNFLDTTVGEVADWRGAFGGVAAGLEPVSYECKLKNRELLLTSFSHSTAITVAVVIALSVVVTFGGIMLDDDVPALVAGLFVPIVLGSFVVSYLIGVVSVAVSYGGFSARRRGSRIEVERGLLQRVFSGIDIERVQSVEVRQSFVRRLMGYCEVSLGRIGAAGESGNGTNNNSNLDARGLVIHPFVKVDRVDELLAGLAPELADCPRTSDLQPLPAVSLRRALLRNCVWYNGALYTAIAFGVGWALVHGYADGMRSMRAFLEVFDLVFGAVVVVCVLATAASAANAVLWSRHSGYALSRKYVALRNDGLSTRFIAIPRQKVQSGNTRSNPFQRRLDLTSIVATTAAGTTATSVRLLDVPRQAGEAYLDWLKPRR